MVFVTSYKTKATCVTQYICTFICFVLVLVIVILQHSSNLLNNLCTYKLSSFSPVFMSCNAFSISLFSLLRALASFASLQLLQDTAHLLVRVCVNKLYLGNNVL